MSWHYSQALVEEYSEANCLDGERSAPWKSNPTHAVYCSNDKMTASFIRSLCGTTSVRSTASHGADTSMSSAEVSPARTSAPQEKAQDWPVSDPVYGLRWPASSARFNRDTSSWRIHPCLFPEDSMSCSVTLPRWGTVAGGVLSARTTPALHTGATGYGYLPTPNACDATKGPAAELIPGGKQKSMRNLVTIAKRDPMAQMWPTPVARDYHAQGPNAVKNGHALQLSTLIQKMHPNMWPTPRKFMHKDATHDRGKSNLGEVVGELHDGGQLNPTWVEWLMGWPLEWTDLKPLATDKFQQWLHSHGDYSEARNDN